MAVVTGLSGEVDSWSGTFNAATLALIDPAEFSLDMNIDELETTGFVRTAGTQAVVETAIPGLRDWRGSFSGVSLDGSSVASNGIAGNVSGATYSTNVMAWEITMTAGEIDITPFQASASWRSFAPGLVRWSGTYEAFVDDTTSIAIPDASAVTATFTLRSGSTWVGSIFAKPSVVTRVGDATKVRYTFRGTGNLTVAGTAAIMPANSGTVATPAAGTLVLMAKDNNGTGDVKYTGSAFWTKITARCRVGEPVSASVDFRGTGALTPAP